MRNINTGDLYKQYDIIDFEHLIDLELKTNFYKILNKKLKANLEIEFNNEIHNHTTRQSKNMRKIRTKNKYGALSVINRGINASNKLPSPLKKIKSVTSFKRQIKKIILESQKKEMN